MIWEIASVLATGAAIFLALLAGCMMQRSVDATADREKDHSAVYGVITLIAAIGFAALGWWLA